MTPAPTPLERLAIGIASVLLSVGLIALLSGFFASRDSAGVSGGGSAPRGIEYPDQGHAHLPPGALHPGYDSDPPTSGPHVPVGVERSPSTLTDDQLLESLELGDVVIAFGTPRPPRALSTLARSIAGPFSPQLAAGGQAVILDARPGTHGLIALAWTRMLPVASAADPALRAFATGWLGHGAPSR